MRSRRKTKRLFPTALGVSTLLHAAALVATLGAEQLPPLWPSPEPIAIDFSSSEPLLSEPATAVPEPKTASAPGKPAVPLARAAAHPVAALAADATAVAPNAPSRQNPNELAHFVLGTSISFATTAAPTAPVTASGRGGGEPPAVSSAAPLPESQVSVKARLLSGASAAYPAAARAAEVEGDVVVELVVSALGRVIDARSITQLGYGLEAAALQAVQGYAFSPARKDGVQVPVRMRWAVEFRLR